MSSLRPVGRSAAMLDVGRSAATLDKDRVSACRFTFADSCTLPLLHPSLLHSYTLALSALTHLNATLTTTSQVLILNNLQQT